MAATCLHDLLDINSENISDDEDEKTTPHAHCTRGGSVPRFRGQFCRGILGFATAAGLDVVEESLEEMVDETDSVSLPGCLTRVDPWCDCCC